MRQGTTPKHIFTLPFAASLASVIQITYQQGNEIVLQKNTGDCTPDGNTVSVKLTQEDTFKFDARQDVMIQIRVLTAGGDALTSDIIRVSVGRCLDDEVLE